MAVTDKINLLGTEYEIGAKAENVSYSGQVPNVSNVKDALDSLQTQVNNGGGSGGTQEHHVRVLSYNIGHFCMGYAPNSGIADTNTDQTIAEAANRGAANANYAIQLKRWKNRLKSICPDIMCLTEYDLTFGVLSGTNQTSASTVFEDYPYIQTAYISGWWRNAFVGLPKLTTYSLVDIVNGYTYNGEAAGENKALHSTFYLGGKTVHLFCVQLHHNGNNSLKDYNTRINAEIPNLVALYDLYDYIILCGDFNTEGVCKANKTLAEYADGVNEFQPFIDKGFTCLNRPTNQLFTCPAIGTIPNNADGMPYQCIDNIIVKGFEIVSSELINDGTLTDHCGLVADLKMIV